MRALLWIATAMVFLAATAAHAQDTGGVTAARERARQLNVDGVALLSKNDYSGALEKFQQAYEAFASPKVLLNIAAALAKLQRLADAANVYQRWLDDPGADSARRKEVQTLLTSYDAKVGRLAISASEPDAEVKIEGWSEPWQVAGASPEWIAAASVALERVPAGSYVVHARKEGFQPADASGEVAAGVSVDVSLALVAEVKQEPKRNDVVDHPKTHVAVVEPAGDVHRDVVPVESRAPGAIQLGGVVDVAIDGKGQGLAMCPGILVRVARRVDVVGKALIGGSTGGYLGASLQLLAGTFRPTIGAGVPLFFSNGVRAGVRGSAGLDVEIGARFAAIAEVGAEYVFNAEMTKLAFDIVPVLGVRARL